MTGLLRHALHLSWGIVDIVRRLTVLVFAGGVERLVGEDLADLHVGGDGPAVVDEQFGHASCVVLAEVEDPAFAGDVVLRDAAAPVDPVDSGPYGGVRSRRFGSFVLGDGLPARRPGAAGRRLAVPPLVEFCLRPGREFGVGQGLALGAARFSGGSPAERAARPLLVVDVLEFGELFVEPVDRGRQGTGGEPLLQGAVVAFDLALRPGVVGSSVALAHAHQRERAFGMPRGGADQSGGVHGAVVGERPGGDAVFGARLKERGLHVVHRHRGERTRVQQVAGVVVEPGDDHGSRNRGDRPVGEVRLPSSLGRDASNLVYDALGRFPGSGRTRPALTRMRRIVEFAGGLTPSRSSLAAMDSAPASRPSFSSCLRSPTIREARTALVLLAIVCAARERGRSPESPPASHRRLILHAHWRLTP